MTTRDEFLSTAALDRMYDITISGDVRQLIEEVRHHRRQLRVDLAIARQLGRAINENGKLQARVAELERH
jgi:hypothetical protein